MRVARARLVFPFKLAMGSKAASNNKKQSRKKPTRIDSISHTTTEYSWIKFTHARSNRFSVYMGFAQLNTNTLAAHITNHTRSLSLSLHMAFYLTLFHSLIRQSHTRAWDSHLFHQFGAQNHTDSLNHSVLSTYWVLVPLIEIPSSNKVHSWLTITQVCITTNQKPIFVSFSRSNKLNNISMGLGMVIFVYRFDKKEKSIFLIGKSIFAPRFCSNWKCVCIPTQTTDFFSSSVLVEFVFF